MATARPRCCVPEGRRAGEDTVHRRHRGRGAVHGAQPGAVSGGDAVRRPMRAAGGGRGRRVPHDPRVPAGPLEYERAAWVRSSAGRWPCHFPPQTAKRFRLVITELRGKGGLAEIELSGAARLERFVEKQLGKMHPTPLPMWDTYLWPKTAEPEVAGLGRAARRRAEPDATSWPPTARCAGMCPPGNGSSSARA